MRFEDIDQKKKVSCMVLGHSNLPDELSDQSPEKEQATSPKNGQKELIFSKFSIIFLVCV